MKRICTLSLLILGVIVFTIAISISGYFILDFFFGGDSEGEVVLADISSFENAEEFREYLTEAQEQDFAELGFRSAEIGALEPEPGFAEEDLLIDESVDFAAGESPERVSSTNVQVQGIDEPDIVKTDGETIFFSNVDSWYRPTPMIEDMETDVYYEGSYDPYNYTDVIDAFPPEDLAQQSTIPTSGNLLLSDDSLMIFEYDKISAYDVSNPEIPEASWDITYEDSTSYVTARLYDNKLYLVTQTYVYPDDPCPLKPLSTEMDEIQVVCSDIYYPRDVIPADSTYTITIVDTSTGEVQDVISFLGTAGYTIVYMSPQNIYVTYTFTGNIANIMIDLFIENAELFPNSLIERLETLKSYTLSMNAKMTEIMTIYEQYEQTLDDDERARIDTEMENRAEDYMQEHVRELFWTGITKIPISSLKIDAAGSVPGELLNQFSLDEYDGNLRVATTIGGTWLSMGGSVESANDVYVLDDDLDKIGEVLDLGMDESIYSVRFIGKMGFVVTFRQTDPFYVIDLSNPRLPLVQGELKIPGFSSYLHPLPDYTILGIGKEDWKVKISLFDVSDPTNPIEKDKYSLNEYWSDVSETHHAFLHDPEHSVFFMPAGSSGYIFSYENDKLSLERVVSDNRAQRAIYLDDYLYVIGETKIVVLDENTWEDVSELDLGYEAEIKEPVHLVIDEPNVDQ